MSDNIFFKPAYELGEMVKSQEMTSEELTEKIIERIQRVNPIINAYCTTSFDMARDMAKKADTAVKNGEKLGLLTGIPISIKDLVSIKGVRTTFGSKIFENYIPEENSHVVNKLIDAGCVILGKTNTPEFGFKGVTDNKIFGVSRNPWNLERTPGGSSGGAAAATASGISPLAQGSDGGGSIRHPCSFCGVFGLKPSLGKVAIYPRVAIFAQTLAAIGPITRYVKDAALMLDAMKGPYEGDRMSIPDDKVNYFKEVDEKPKKLRIGYSMNLGFAKVIDEEVEKGVLDGVHKFENFGWMIEESKIKLRRPESPFYTLWTSKIGFYLKSKMKEWGDQIDPDLVQMAELGMTYSGGDVVKAMNNRRKICDIFHNYFKDYDILVTPATAVPAFKLGMMYPSKINGKSVSPTGWQPFSFPFNLTGHPTATIPCGWSSEGLPIGMQIVGKRYDELTVLQVSQAFEEIAPWQDKKPSLN